MVFRLLAVLAASLSLSVVPARASELAAYTLVGPRAGSGDGSGGTIGGPGIARVITDDARCPAARIDGRSTPMVERSAPKTFAPRASTSLAATTRPSVFPVRVCEIGLPSGVRSVTIAGKALALPPRVVRRIVLIGDTGCRLKASPDPANRGAWQACGDAAAWPFARVARAAAALHPDLVLHVGDYLYREDACPAGNAGCADAVWGYGWEGWNADFFTPAAPLLKVAPWVVVRGNHEECLRAGQGWWLLLDPHPLVAGADCSDPVSDFAGNHSDPYAVELGHAARLIIADFSAIGEKHLVDPALTRYRGDAAVIRQLAVPGEVNFVADHPPFAAVTTGGKTGSDKKALRTGYASIGDAFGAGDTGTTSDNLPQLPAVAAVLSGHVHLLQYVERRGYPAQVVNGFSGTQEDEPTAPATLAELRALPGGDGYKDIVTRFGQFGFGVLERLADGRWRYTARDVAGHVILSRLITAPK